MTYQATYTVDRQWCSSERHLGKIPMPWIRYSFWGGLSEVVHLERHICFFPWGLSKEYFAVTSLTVHGKQNVKFTKSRGSYLWHIKLCTYLDIGNVSKYEVIFFFNTSLGKQAEGENIYKRLARMDMQQILEIFYGKTWLSSFAA